jgi:hypothetical protein
MDTNSSVCLSCILFTLEGQGPENNQYFPIFLMWLSQLVLKGDMRSDDRLVVKIDKPTLDYIQTNPYLVRLLQQLVCKIDFVLHPPPKTLLEGMMWKYSTMTYSQDIFMYCDIDIFILKSIHSSTDTIKKDCIYVHAENLPLSDPFFGSAFTQEELNVIPSHLAGINAGKFIIRGSDLQQQFFTKILQLNAEIDGSSFVCCEQPFFNKALYTNSEFPVKLFSEKDIFLGFRTDLYPLYEKEKDSYLFFDCCGNAGDGIKHFQSMFYTFLMLRAEIF